MHERYFEGVEFRDELPSRDFSEEELEKIRQLFHELDIESIEDIKAPIGEWNTRSVSLEFVRILRQLEKKTGQLLPLDGMNISYVEPKEMRPRSINERRYLVEQYGDYMRDGGAGDCERLPGGRFNIRIAAAGRENELSRTTVLGLLGHEYGHTLGERMEEQVLEELKANAFSAIVLSEAHMLDISLGYELSETHDQSRYMLDYLTGLGISEPAIISHLIQTPFMGVYPDSYKRMMKQA